jgi:hypothetical protein
MVMPEMPIAEEFLHKFIIQGIEGPNGDQYPGTGYYQKLYSEIPAKVAKGELGGFFKVKPDCIADLVLIDSTRYIYPGIIATLLAHNLTRRDTVFLIENDFWSSPDGDERRLLERHWRLADVSAAAPAGEAWPWLTFRIAGQLYPGQLEV